MSQFVVPHYDRYYAYDLNVSFKKIFLITDSKSYPADKYSEIVNLNDRFRGTFKNTKMLEDSTYRNSDSSLYERGYEYEVNNVLQLAEVYYHC